MELPNEIMKCPRCHKALAVDSVREYGDGRRRIYWECQECDLSIMDRGRKK
ncbi:hypothetical protein H6758_05210 [Candidatus Nomurabacteria bacterium]|nr:hypothetical protein [Candidatus Nomurabacteria bacterium]